MNDSAVDARRDDLKKRLKKYWILYLFILPSFLLLLVFNYGPLVGLTMVFQEYNPVKGFFASKWVGLDNFKILFNSPSFVRAIWNTLAISMLKLIFVFPAPIILALLLNEVRRMVFKKVVQTIIYIPNFVSWVVVSGVFYTLLSYGGVVNNILMSLKIISEPIIFMQMKSIFYPIIIFTDIWKSVGVSSIFYMAAIANIPQEQYEAAETDGAGRLAQIIYITLPSIAGTISLLFILQVSGILSAGFDQLWTMGNLAVKDIAQIIDTAVLTSMQTGTGRDYSVGAAFGLFKSAISLLLFFLTNFVLSKMNQETIV